MMDREAYQAEELDCYLETLRAGQTAALEIELPEKERRLAEKILELTDGAVSASPDLSLETAQKLTDLVSLNNSLPSGGQPEPLRMRRKMPDHQPGRRYPGLPLVIAGLLARRGRTWIGEESTRLSR